MRLRDSYDVPEEVARGPHSEAFGKFLYNWFGDTSLVLHGELDFAFLKDLTPEELTLARELIRRNLKLKHCHLFDGVAALRDLDAIPILRAMFQENDKWQMTIAHVLWRLNRDPVFVEFLEHQKERRELAYCDLDWALELDDERVTDLLFDLLPDQDEDSWSWNLMVHLARRWPSIPFARRIANTRLLKDYDCLRALALLNRLEEGRAVSRREFGSPSYYRDRRYDDRFRAKLLESIHRWNARLNWGLSGTLPVPESVSGVLPSPSPPET